MNKTDEYFLAKITHLYDSVKRDAYPKFTSFLDEHQYSLAKEFFLHRSGVLFWGGALDLERVLLCIYPDYLEADDLEYPISFLQISYPKAYVLTHRDVLGSLMALQIKRETIGDILIGEGLIEIAVLEHIVPMVESIQKIGRVGVKIQQISELSLKKKNSFRLVQGTVSSLRLDCVVAMITKLSRNKAADLIRAGKVFVNHLEVLSIDTALKEGDTFTIRGYGKFDFSESPRLTKKMRYHVTIYQYI